jgi:hypothetical protein
MLNMVSIIQSAIQDCWFQQQESKEKRNRCHGSNWTCIWVIDCRIYTILAVALYINILSCNM